VVLTVLIVAITVILGGRLAAAAPSGLRGIANGAHVPGSSAAASAGSDPTSAPLPTPVPLTQVVYAAGDLSDCPGAVPAVVDLIRDSQSPILALGDIVHPTGRPEEYANCFDPTWQDVKARLRPVPGNHDYQTPGAVGYYEYFGDRAGDPSRGYYSFNIGWWHIVALNSICGPIGGCQDGSPQIQWLTEDLAAHPTSCTLAYWHHPRFASGNGAAVRRTTTLWRTLYEAGVDLVLNGHDHDYERFAPMDPAGRLDGERGIRQFIVGTGGANLTRRERVAENSEVWTNAHHGILELTLHHDGYAWRFLAADGGTVIDRGTGSCH
jgi:hypothetical protein